MKKISQLSVQRVDERIVVKNEFKNFADTLFMTAFLIKAIAKTNKIKPEEVLDILKGGLSGSDNKDGTILLNTEQTQNQKAIECLKEIKAYIEKNESPSFVQTLDGYWFISSKKLFEYINTKIKELEGE